MRFHFPEQANGLFLNITGESTTFRLPEGTLAWHQAWAQDSCVLTTLHTSADRDFTIPEVCDSARVHGLGVWLYVNQRALYQHLDCILPLYRRWGSVD